MGEPRDSKDPRAARTEWDVHWTQARQFLCHRLRRELGGRDGDDLEDLTQEALTRLLRALRHKEAQNLEALMNEIARRTAIDHVRRRRRWAKLVEPLTDSVDGPGTGISPAADELGEPVERLRFVVLEFFTNHASTCHGLALAYFACRDWRGVARDLGKNYDAVRRQWSRCVEVLRTEARQDPGLLMEWTSDGEGKP
jgi:DNA-directed RNA polymerase specialized sigma24 family protein